MRLGDLITGLDVTAKRKIATSAEDQTLGIHVSHFMEWTVLVKKIKLEEYVTMLLIYILKASDDSAKHLELQDSITGPYSSSFLNVMFSSVF
jgi:hypothetical protein